MRQLSNIWFIALKELRLFLVDRFALFMFILFPFFFVFLFGVVMADVGAEDDRLELHLVTLEEAGGISHEIISAIETKDVNQLKPGEPVIIWDRDYASALKAVEDKEMAGFLVFPGDFTDSIFAGESNQLDVVANAEDPYAQAALYGLANAITSQIGSYHVAGSAIMELLLEQGTTIDGGVVDIGQVIQQLFAGEDIIGNQGALITYGIDKVGEVKAELPSNYTIPGYLVMFVFFAAALSAERIVRERQNHTLERLLASTVRRETLLAGIFVGTAAKGLLQIAIFWTVGILVFNIDLGLSPVAVVILSLLMVIMSSAFGIMLATLVKTERGAGSIAVLASLILAPLGGSWWPLFITPQWMQFLAKFTPHGWANTGFNKLMLFGAEFNAVVPEMLVLIGFAVLFGLIGIWRFRAGAV